MGAACAKEPTTQTADAIADPQAVDLKEAAAEADTPNECVASPGVDTEDAKKTQEAVVPVIVPSAPAPAPVEEASGQEALSEEEVAGPRLIARGAEIPQSLVKELQVLGKSPSAVGRNLLEALSEDEGAAASRLIARRPADTLPQRLIRDVKVLGKSPLAVAVYDEAITFQLQDPSSDIVVAALEALAVSPETVSKQQQAIGSCLLFGELGGPVVSGDKSSVHTAAVAALVKSPDALERYHEDIELKLVSTWRSDPYPESRAKKLILACEKALGIPSISHAGWDPAERSSAEVAVVKRHQEAIAKGLYDENYSETRLNALHALAKSAELVKRHEPSHCCLPTPTRLAARPPRRCCAMSSAGRLRSHAQWSAKARRLRRGCSKRISMGCWRTRSVRCLHWQSRLKWSRRTMRRSDG